MAKVMVKLTEAEISNRAVKLAEKVTELEMLKAEKKAQTAEWNSEIKGLDKDIVDLAKTVQLGHEEREEAELPGVVTKIRDTK